MRLKKSTFQHERLCRDPSRPADFVPTEPPPRRVASPDGGSGAPNLVPRNPAPRRRAARARRRVRRTCSWSGYEFQIHRPDASWNAVAGVYIFAKRVGRLWEAVYVGETTSFADEIPAHERWPEARSMGATHVHVRAEPFRRREIEEELIRAHAPSLNG